MTYNNRNGIKRICDDDSLFNASLKTNDISLQYKIPPDTKGIDSKKIKIYG
jgi:hypothetical protein